MADIVKNNLSSINNESEFSVENISFEAKEAFNLLRTNLGFSFSDNKKSHVIGITSSIEETGKSLIATNLAYSLAKTNKKVLLVDGDLRLSTVAKKLKLNTKPGLSNLLVSTTSYKTIIQKYNDMVDVVVAGDVPPNPSELLNSERFSELLKEFGKEYEYIIVDLPPINIVSDALVISNNIDGFVLVIRKDHDEKQLVKEMIRKLNLANAKIIGMVFNTAKIEEKK